MGKHFKKFQKEKQSKRLLNTIISKLRLPLQICCIDGRILLHVSYTPIKKTIRNIVGMYILDWFVPARNIGYQQDTYSYAYLCKIFQILTFRNDPLGTIWRLKSWKLKSWKESDKQLPLLHPTAALPPWARRIFLVRKPSKSWGTVHLKESRRWNDLSIALGDFLTSFV